MTVYRNLTLRLCFRSGSSRIVENVKVPNCRESYEVGWATTTKTLTRLYDVAYRYAQCLGAYECPDCEYVLRPPATVIKMMLEDDASDSTRKKFFCRGRCLHEKKSIALVYVPCSVRFTWVERGDNLFFTHSGVHMHRKCPLMHETEREKRQRIDMVKRTGNSGRPKKKIARRIRAL